tara:strand:- start:2439 stop:2975 length:537 start_codon:yes stop_codon:yes gene_type:complete
MATLINILTFSRIIFALIIFLFLMLDKFLFLAFIFFVLGGLSDYFDGYLARKHNATSQIGEILDPIADKIFIIFLFFGVSLNLSSFLLGFAGAIIISREIWVSALRDYNSRNNNTNATKVTFIAKIKTFVQMFTLSIYLFALAFNFMILIPIADIFAISSILITLYTGYLYTYSTFKN